MMKPTKFTATYAGYTFKRSSLKPYTYAIITEKAARPGVEYSRPSADGKTFFCTDASWSQSLELAQKTAARERKWEGVVAVHIVPAVAQS